MSGEFTIKNSRFGFKQRADKYLLFREINQNVWSEIYSEKAENIDKNIEEWAREKAESEFI